VRGSEAEISLVAILESHELLPINLPPSALPPKFGRRGNGQQELLGAGPVHLLSNNPFDLPDDPQTQWQVVVDPSAHLTDHSGADQEFVTNNLSVGRVLFQRGDESSAPVHNLLF